MTEDCGFKESFIPVYEYEFDEKSRNDEKSIEENDSEKGEATGIKSDGPKVNDGDEKGNSSVNENDGKQDDDQGNGSENNSESNKDTDDWVKVSKPDSPETPNTQEMHC